ncbi:MAG: dihydrofolate reductase [bacterium]|nr:dihydrofolate reductase [bacterium]
MIAIIVATSLNGAIGYLNEIPWYLPRDLKRFKEKTVGHTTLMGRKTHESIIKRLGHPLPDRRSIVLTRQKNFKAPDCEVASSWEEALEATKGDNLFVIGGAEIYSLALPHADKIFHTLVHTVTLGDAYFTFDPSAWQLVNSERVEADEKNEFACTFNDYERK